MDYKPMSLHQFLLCYGSETACLEAVVQHRWPDGFVCPKCRHGRGCRLQARRAIECYGCGRQISITAGTLFARSHLPLTKWFLAIYLLAANKPGISAQSLSKHLEVSYPTAFYLLHKLRRAMLEHDLWYRLSGQVCVDETYVGDFSEDRRRGRSTDRKSAVAVLVEERGANRTGYVHLEPVWRVDAEQMQGVILEKLTPDTVVRTDAFQAYHGIGDKGFIHIRERSRQGREANDQFPLVHRAISNFKKTLLGTYRQGCQRHLDLYAAEFCYRTNRRNRTREQRQHNLVEQTMFDRLLTLAARMKAVTWAAITAARWKPALS